MRRKALSPPRRSPPPAQAAMSRPTLNVSRFWQKTTKAWTAAPSLLAAAADVGGGERAVGCWAPGVGSVVGADRSPASGALPPPADSLLSTAALPGYASSASGRP